MPKSKNPFDPKKEVIKLKRVASQTFGTYIAHLFVMFPTGCGKSTPPVRRLKNIKGKTVTVVLGNIEKSNHAGALPPSIISASPRSQEPSGQLLHTEAPIDMNERGTESITGVNSLSNKREQCASVVARARPGKQKQNHSKFPTSNNPEAGRLIQSRQQVMFTTLAKRGITIYKGNDKSKGNMPDIEFDKPNSSTISPKKLFLRT